ncbi:MAG TPA: signal peptidase II [Bacillota bacterium]|nr:signal peptidase II [Bacillota bacterium]
MEDLFFWLTAVVVLVIDQSTKYLVQHNMVELQSIPLIRDIFHLTYVLNPGAAFGMLPYKTLFFTAIALIMLLVIYLLYRRVPPEQVANKVALGLLAGGALGNLIDRLRFARVVDFFDLRFFSVFNVADIAITFGVGILLLGMALQEWKELQERKERGDSHEEG